MKNASFILKIVSAVLALGAAICCIIAFWDNLQAAFAQVKSALPECPCHKKNEYIDWDEE